MVCVPVTPCRLVETRGSFPAVYQTGGPFAPHEVRTYTLQGGNGGMPDAAAWERDAERDPDAGVRDPARDSSTRRARPTPSSARTQARRTSAAATTSSSARMRGSTTPPEHPMPLSASARDKATRPVTTISSSAAGPARTIRPGTSTPSSATSPASATWAAATTPTSAPGAGGTPGLTNATAIGWGALVEQSNTVVLGSGIENVGIGTTSPQKKLHVVGDVAVGGTLTKGAACFASTIRSRPATRS